MSSTYSSDVEGDGQLVVAHKLKKPDKYRVLLHNDDYTTMDFVVKILCQIFHKSVEDATKIMLNVHEQGIGECGIFTYEIAESKVSQVHGHARKAGFPLRCTMEKA